MTQSNKLEVRTPEEIAQYYELPLQKVLVDFDLNDTTQMVLGTDPINIEELDSIPQEAVKTVICDFAVVTILAHKGDGQRLADIMHNFPPLVSMVIDHATHYVADGVMAFSVNALTEKQIENVEINRRNKIA